MTCGNLISKPLRHSVLFRTIFLKGTTLSSRYKSDDLSALDAQAEAIKISLGPFVFQASRALRDLGILSYLDDNFSTGATVESVADHCELSTYGARVLMDAGLSCGLIWLQDDHYTLTKTGYFLLSDAMCRVNMDFSQDVCNRPLEHLQEAIKTGKPSGLREFGDWPTIYPAVPSLPEKAQKSWFEFDHLYSDRAFPVLLEEVFKSSPKQICDIGGNTGKWALKCTKHDPNVTMTIIDLPEQITNAKANVQARDMQDRVRFMPMNLLEDNNNIPADIDIYWMSQFLDCFSEDEIINILSQIRQNMRPDAEVYILELFWDRQKYDIASLTLNCTSLYFTAIANGNSRFYHSEPFFKALEKSGFEITECIDHIGLGHTLLKCSPK